MWGRAVDEDPPLRFGARGQARVDDAAVGGEVARVVDVVRGGDLGGGQAFGGGGGVGGALDAGQVDVAAVGRADDAVAHAVDAVALAEDLGREEGHVCRGEVLRVGDGQVVNADLRDVVVEVGRPPGRRADQGTIKAVRVQLQLLEPCRPPVEQPE